MIWWFAAGLAAGFVIVELLHRLLEIDREFMGQSLNEPDEHSV